MSEHKFPGNSQIKATSLSDIDRIVEICKANGIEIEDQIVSNPALVLEYCPCIRYGSIAEKIFSFKYENHKVVSIEEYFKEYLDNEELPAMGDYKIRVDSREENLKVRQHANRLGYDEALDPVLSEAKFLFMEVECFVTQATGEHYFNSHKNKELTVEQFLNLKITNQNECINSKGTSKPNRSGSGSGKNESQTRRRSYQHTEGYRRRKPQTIEFTRQRRRSS